MFQFGRFALLGLVLTAAAGVSVNHDTARSAVVPAAPGAEQLARPDQVRLRKLHLVRPDLIPYPISFEVYC